MDHTQINKAQKWLSNSKKAALTNDSSTLISELKKRVILLDKLSDKTTNPAITIEGSYHMIGFNQDAAQSSYIGFLHLAKTGINRVCAEWVIAGEQIQKGTGFFKDNILVINFSYKGEGEQTGSVYKGVVVYEFISAEIITGFWSEKHGNDDYLGIEEGRKLKDSESIFNTGKLN